MDISSLPSRKTIKLGSLSILFILSGLIFGTGCWLQNLLNDLKNNLQTIRTVGFWIFLISIILWCIVAGILGFMIYRGQIKHTKTLLTFLALLTFTSVFGGMFFWYPNNQIVFSNLAYSLGVIGGMGVGFVVGEIVQHGNEVRNQLPNTNYSQL